MAMARMWLVLVGVLLACGLVVTAEVVQPSAEDWAALRTRAESATGEYDRLITNTQDRIKWVKSEVGRALAPTVFPRQPSVAGLEELLQQEKQGAAELDAAFVALLKVQPAERTRERYLAFLRQLKIAGAQCQQYRERLDKGDAAEQEQDAVRELEYKLALLRNNSPERVPAGPLPKGLQLSLQQFPRIDGSTTAQPLSTLIACRVLGLGAEWHVRQIRDLRNAEGTDERILIPAYSEPSVLLDTGATDGVGFPGLRVGMNHSGTHTAYRNLIVGASDIIIVARPPSPDEQALAKEKGVSLDVRPIGYDAFVFLLNRLNPLNSLTVQQIQAIYQDNVLSWSEVGGSNEKVIAFQRERNSGSQETMESLVMKGLQMAPPDRMIVGYGMGGPYNQLVTNRNGIGYTFYYYHTVQSPTKLVTVIAGAVPSAALIPLSTPEPGVLPALKVCAVNGITPTATTIRDGSYPFVTEVYAVVRQNEAATTAAVRLRDWLLTPEGQTLVQESGYVPLR